MLAPIRLTNAAAQLPCGSGETQGVASPPYSTPPPPLREVGMGRGKHLWVEGEASLTPTRFKERFANQYQGPGIG
ncbi:MAG TPA: hypothetical protein VK140_01910 [Ktedonobacteraceae bacterium]|nr:hypothetical protein [Ktedonobacteraceae bacterium]